MRRIDSVRTGVFTVPTDGEEADGTLSWSAATAVTVELVAGDVTGLGWTYSSPAAAGVVAHHLKAVVRNADPADIGGLWSAMRRACRNLGTRGLVMQAISAVDVALWDLKARLLGVPVGALLGAVGDGAPVYGSGGFVNLDDDQLRKQVDGWSAAGCQAVKIKIAQDWGRQVERDLARVHRLRELVGPGVALMVDGNGGYTPGQARRVGAELDDLGVVWFEEPVSSDDLDTLSVLRSALRCDVAAGEYVSEPDDARRLAPAVDCLQLDATRCGGYTGFLAGSAVAAAHHRQVSAHCAPSLHAPVAAAVAGLRHVEWFVDHARLEPELFDGVPTVSAGRLHMSPAVGHGMSLSRRAETYRAG